MKRRVTLLLLALSLGLLGETMSRLFLGVHFHSAESFFHPERLWFHYYPMLRAVLHASNSPNPSRLKVLLVGASVLSEDQGFGAVGRELEIELKGKGIVAEIYNVAAPAHTSIDAWWKYRALKGVHFDLVIYYDGFNEIRANNCADSDFREDYGHYGWYRRLLLLDRHPELVFTALPFVTDLLFSELRHLVSGAQDVPVHEPTPENSRWGVTIKTRNSLRQNLGNFLTLAREKGERVVIGTLATYIPKDYSLNKFRIRALDYGSHLLPIELWSTPEAVAAGVVAHNEVIRTVTEQVRNQGQDVDLIDLEKAIPIGKRYFNDVCHLTDESSRIFAREIVGKGLFGARKPALGSMKP